MKSTRKSSRVLARYSSGIGDRINRAQCQTIVLQILCDFKIREVWVKWETRPLTQWPAVGYNHVRIRSAVFVSQLTAAFENPDTSLRLFSVSSRPGICQNCRHSGGFVFLLMDLQIAGYFRQRAFALHSVEISDDLKGKALGD